MNFVPSYLLGSNGPQRDGEGRKEDSCVLPLRIMVDLHGVVPQGLQVIIGLVLLGEEDLGGVDHLVGGQEVVLVLQEELEGAEEADLGGRGLGEHLRGEGLNLGHRSGDEAELGRKSVTEIELKKH